MWNIYFQPYGPLFAQDPLLYLCFFHVSFCVYVLCVSVYVFQIAVSRDVGVCIPHTISAQGVSLWCCFLVGTFPLCPAHETLLILGSSVPATAGPLSCDPQLIASPQGPNSAHFPLHQSEESFGPPEVQGSHSSGPGQEPRELEGLALHGTNLCGKPSGPTQKTATRDRSVLYLSPAPLAHSL